MQGVCDMVSGVYGHTPLLVLAPRDGDGTFCHCPGTAPHSHDSQLYPPTCSYDFPDSPPLQSNADPDFDANPVVNPQSNAAAAS